MTILDILLATDEWAVRGTLYYQRDPLRLLANNVYEGINTLGGL